MFLELQYSAWFGRGDDRCCLDDVKDRRSYSGIAVWVKGSVENTLYPVVCVFQEREHGLVEFW